MIEMKAGVHFVRWCRSRCFGVGSDCVPSICGAGSREVVWESPRIMNVVVGWSRWMADDVFL